MTALSDTINALEFYADRHNYVVDPYGGCEVRDDEGDLANEALTRIEDSDAVTRRLAEMLLGREGTRALLEFVRDEITNELNAITLVEMEAK